MSSSSGSRNRSRKRAKDEIRRLISSGSSGASGASVVVESAAAAAAAAAGAVEQPLNLCVRDSGGGSSSGHPALRRRKKRSAIFLPPEKLANDVCICKFKFVAGNQPRLQEKKILSIDSGGNFRFFPESQRAARKLPDLLPIETVLPLAEPAVVASTSASPSSSTSMLPATTKRLSRRKRMEKTFGEQGFLIQTQHVPATEGSAFCKFRQLKKFTRYLYRSWKHYLPPEEPDHPEG
uniref:EOG090X02D0 n=1 Tax=Evadne anonyx TaxID=141404 RepID=A0A9N6ZF74_9CRUS|nr:EOG090X02D0 [Evadne anonyx]